MECAKLAACCLPQAGHYFGIEVRHARCTFPEQAVSPSRATRGRRISPEPPPRDPCRNPPPAGRRRGACSLSHRLQHRRPRRLGAAVCHRHHRPDRGAPTQPRARCRTPAVGNLTIPRGISLGARRARRGARARLAPSRSLLGAFSEPYHRRAGSACTSTAASGGLWFPSWRPRARRRRTASILRCVTAISCDPRSREIKRDLSRSREVARDSGARRHHDLVRSPQVRVRAKGGVGAHVPEQGAAPPHVHFCHRVDWRDALRPSPSACPSPLAPRRRPSRPLALVPSHRAPAPRLSAARRCRAPPRRHLRHADDAGLAARRRGRGDLGGDDALRRGWVRRADGYTDMSMTRP